MELVLNLDQCTWCGEKNTGMMGLMVREEIYKGNMGEDVIGSTMINVFTVIDARRPPLAGARIPAMRLYSDICSKCGRQFNFRMERGHATIPLRPGEPPVFA